MIEMKGIDVSKHQGYIDWKKVKAAGIDFAIIRAGYGQTYKDERFDEYVKGCIDNNIKIGFYWFLYCTNVAEAIKNAEKFHTVICNYKSKISMKVWCDFEYDTDKKANAKGVVFTKASRTDCVNAFCKKLESYGYEVGNYANQDYLNNKLNAINYPLWFAKYSAAKGSRECLMWQYTSSGSVSGIAGKVDMDIYYMPGNEKKVPEVANPTLKRGAKGDEVKKLQEDLNYLGAKLAVDGSFGPGTEKKVKDWQQENHLQVDGSYGPKSYAKMKELLK